MERAVVGRQSLVVGQSRPSFSSLVLPEILAWASDETTATNEQQFMTDGALCPATKGAALVSKAISQQVDVNH
jgi:hypothetical protein